MNEMQGILSRRASVARLAVAALLAFAWAVLPTVVLACPFCKDALAGDSVGSALSWTTLLMIAFPLSLFGSIGGWVVVVYWRAARHAANEDAAALWPVWAEKESET